jgi:hypothetical protein
VVAHWLNWLSENRILGSIGGLDWTMWARGSELLGARYYFYFRTGSIYGLTERKDHLLGSKLVGTNAIVSQPSST